jgi:hypothetical protein
VTVRPHPDLAGQFGSIWTLPGSAIAGTPLSGKVSAMVSNVGNAPLPLGQTVTIAFVARDTTHPTNPDVPLLTLSNQPVSALPAGRAQTFTAMVALPSGLQAGRYQILANILPVEGETNTANNVVTATAARTTKTLTVIPATVDLAGNLGRIWTLPSSVFAGKPLSGTVSVVVSNLGNVPLPTGQQVNIQFLARDLTHPANQDIILATLTNQSVSALATNGSRTFSTTISRPAGLPADGYEIVATIAPVQSLTESHLANNLVTLTATGLHKALVAF